MTSTSDDPGLASGDEPETVQTANEMVNEMIRDTVAEVPSAAKWIVSNPELLAKKARQKQARERAAKGKAGKASGNASGQRKRKDADADADMDDGEPAPKPPQKRMKKHKASVDTDDDDDDKPQFAISAYIHILRQNLPTAPSKTCGKKPGNEYIQRGPLQFQSTDSYDDFLHLVAKTLPCPGPEHIIASKITWKPQKPMKAEALLLGGALGFSIMIDELAGKASRVITLTMPPPAKPVDEVPFWDTGETKGATSQADEAFAYDELELQSTTDSIAQQRVTFDKAVGPKRSELEDKYPVDNDPLFPGKRIYTDNKTGFQFELNTGRITVWASHLARGTATLDQPPATPLFDCSQRIKTRNVPSPPASSLPPTGTSVGPVPQAPIASMPSITELLLLQLFQNQQTAAHASLFATPHQHAPPMPVVPAISVPSLASLPPSPAKLRRVTLDEFCTHYEISEADRGRLQKLDFQPGDPIERLERVEWHDEGGFQRLGWDRILSKNRKFLRDVRTGTVWPVT